MANGLRGQGPAGRGHRTYLWPGDARAPARYSHTGVLLGVGQAADPPREGRRLSLNRLGRERQVEALLRSNSGSGLFDNSPPRLPRERVRHSRQGFDIANALNRLPSTNKIEGVN